MANASKPNQASKEDDHANYPLTLLAWQAAGAIAQDAKVAHGGGRPAGYNRGWFVEPTVLIDCHQDMDLFNTESFGPVAPICRVKSFDEAFAVIKPAGKGGYR